MDRLTARANLRGRRIDLDYTFRGPSARPGLRLLRRRGDEPTGPNDGLTVFDLSELLDPTGKPWARIERARFLLLNGVAEGGILQAELALFHAAGASGSQRPSRAVVTFYTDQTVSAAQPPFSGVFRQTLDNLTLVAVSPTNARLDDAHVSVNLRGDGIDVGALDLIIDVAAGVITMTGLYGLTFTAGFTWSEVQTTAGTSMDLPGGWTRSSFTTRIGEQRIRALTLTEGPIDEATLERVRIVEVADEEPSRGRRFELGAAGVRTKVFTPGLEPEAVFCYALFRAASLDVQWRSSTFESSVAAAWSTSPELRGEERATGHYASGDRLYTLLPEFHRINDEPDPPDPRGGPLRRLLQIFGGALDQTRSGAEGLRSRHDIYTAHPGGLVHLARWIGWEPDQTRPSRTRRSELLVVPEIYGTVGTLPGIQRTIEYEAGWPCRIKEFVNNVFLTNGVDPNFTWELWSISPTGRRQETLAPRGMIGAIDGRPSAVADANRSAWLFWQASTPGRREIRVKKIGDPPSSGLPAVDAVEQPPGVTDESPAAVVWNNQIWLFWDSDRSGRWSIWERSISNPVALVPASGIAPPPDPPVMTLATDASSIPPRLLVSSSGEDRNPAVIVDKGDRLWLIWQRDWVDRSHIYARSCAIPAGSTAPVWDAEIRLTSGRVRDSAPTVMLDTTDPTYPNGKLWVFFAREFGDRSEIWAITSTPVGGWSAPALFEPSLRDNEGNRLAPAQDRSPVSLAASDAQGNALAVVAWESDRLAPGEVPGGGPVRHTWIVVADAKPGQPLVWMDRGGVINFGDVPMSFREVTGVAIPRAAGADPASGSFDGFILYRSQKGSADDSRSRTYANTDPAARRRGDPEDRWHYLYDVRPADDPTLATTDPLYARDMVGVYLSAPAATDLDRREQQRVIDRVKAYIEPFRPLPVRLLWFAPDSTSQGAWSAR